ncbi:motility associated factor glycosyltransferase family protein [Thermolongibacillus altinsuensis]|uniref:motility associated factor glycosyltransferase family protein n=1 Tax=Thermolongibacillus altinsuensis TaxID=575256 RepID=UPI00242A2F56|nr:6-hydroxymethylpterin diphosphokinase MptE-like protein [Thermolongibacillus altinsuensis]GMB09127.1 hypothetical protein B1no1_18370 [Thermolongibacillus altinsuensis]
MSLFDNNLKLLKKYHPSIYHQVSKMHFNENEVKREWEIVYTRSGFPTLIYKGEGLNYLLHSKYDPIKEAKNFIKNNLEESANGYIVYGFGLGYHIKELLENIEAKELVIFETRPAVFYLALKYVNLEGIVNNTNIKIYLEDDVKSFVQEFNKIELKEYQLIIHGPSLKIMPKDFTDIKFLFENYKVHQNSFNRHKLLLQSNFQENIKRYHQSVDVLFGKWINQPIVIVSAGPSLDKNKHLLRDIQNRALIMSVGTALKPLLQIDVIPDFVIITDPQDIVYNQIDGLEDLEIPLIALSTCNKHVLQNYKGYKFIAFQEGYDLAEQYARENNIKLVKTGGSVSTTALDISIQFGCNPIIFVGLDLAYTNNKTHVKGTYFYQENVNSKFLRPIKSISGETVYTTKNLYIYLKWIEKRISMENNITFIDATEGGAYIQGTEILDLETVIQHRINNATINKDLLQKIIAER